jgi:hypothetical protein
MNGLINKLKVRVIYPRDLYQPKHDVYSWNPHIDWVVIRIFRARCASFHMYPYQHDYMMAYLQIDMRRPVSIKFPDFWTQYLPPDCAQYTGRPLLLTKALYGYNYSWKYPYKAECLRSLGWTPCQLQPALWYKIFPNNGLIIILQYSDAMLSASTDFTDYLQFKTVVSKHFVNKSNDLQIGIYKAHINQYADSNITLDHSQYAHSTVERYLPNAPTDPS